MDAQAMAAGAGQAAEQQQKAQQEAMMKESMLTQILAPEAKTRLDRVKIVKPEKAAQIQEMLLKMAKSGQLQGQIGEQQLVQMLEGIGAQAQQQTVKTMRKASAFDDSDDDDNDDDFY